MAKPTFGIRLAAFAAAICSAAFAGQVDRTELVSLAKASIRAEVEGRAPLAISGKTSTKPVFVTIERKGRILGCRGSLEPRGSSLEEAVALAARSAARHDPRYPPLTPKDLDDFQVTITIVDRLSPISGVDSLQPCDGLVLRAGSKVGVVLPWEGKDPKVRLNWAYKKAGVAPGSACRLQLMKAERFRG